MADKLMSLLGLCRRAGKLVLGNDPVIDSINLKKAKLVAYSHGDYLELGKKIGTFGYSVKKKKPLWAFMCIFPSAAASASTATSTR